MKQIDVTSNVMQKVKSFERSEISRFFRFFIGVLTIFMMMIVVGFYMIVTDLMSKRAFDVFELFTQDPEIIGDFWRDTLIIFWDEIPMQILVAVTLLMAIVAVIIFITRKKRSQIKKKLTYLDKSS